MRLLAPRNERQTASDYASYGLAMLFFSGVMAALIIYEFWFYWRWVMDSVHNYRAFWESFPWWH